MHSREVAHVVSARHASIELAHWVVTQAPQAMMPPSSPPRSPPELLPPDELPPDELPPEELPELEPESDPFDGDPLSAVVVGAEPSGLSTISITSKLSGLRAPQAVETRTSEAKASAKLRRMGGQKLCVRNISL